MSPRPLPKALAVIVWLLLAPFRLTAALVVFSWRLLLFVVTILLCGYFVFSMYFAGQDILKILNDTLRGSFAAEQVYVSPFSDHVILRNVDIKIPSGESIIKAEYVSVQFDRGKIASWGFRKANEGLGGSLVSSGVPIRLSQIRVEGFLVLLPFSETDFRFLEAFQPRNPAPDDGEPPGPAPIVELEDIQVNNGQVILDFPWWRMDIGVETAKSNIIIKDAKVRIEASGVSVPEYSLKGLIPAPASFVGEETSAIRVAEFLMDGTSLSFSGLDVRHPDFDATGAMSFDIGKQDFPVQASGTFDMHNPMRTEELSLGHVFGTASGSFRMYGHLVRPAFDFEVKSPALRVEFLDIRDITSSVRLAVQNDGVHLEVPETSARIWGTRVEARDFVMDAGASGVNMAFSGCADRLYLSELASEFDIEALNQFGDIPVRGCLKQATLEFPNEEIRIRGEASVESAGGAFPESLGITGMSIAADLDMNMQQLSLTNLMLDSTIGTANGQFSLVFGSDTPEILLDLKAEVPSLAAIPVLKEEGINGDITVAALQVHGPVDNPSAWVATSGREVVIQNNVFDELSINVSFADGFLTTEPVCFEHSLSRGCLALDVNFGTDWMNPSLPIEVALSLEDTLVLDLDNIPFVDLPSSGTLSAGPLDVRVTITSDIEETLASLQASGHLVLDHFYLGEYGALLLEADFTKQPSPVEDGYLSSLQASLTGFRLVAPNMTLKDVVAQVDLRTLVLPAGATLFPKVSARGSAKWSWFKKGTDFFIRKGDVEFDLLDLGNPVSIASAVVPDIKVGGRIGLERVGYGKNRIRKLDVTFDGTNPNGLLTAQGKAELDTQLKGSFSLSVDRPANTAALSLDVNRLPVAAVPWLQRIEAVRNLLSDTRLTASLSVSKVDLRAITTGDWRALLKKMEGRGRIGVIGLSRLPEPVEKVEARFTAAGGRVTVKPLTIKRPGETPIEVTGSYNLTSNDIDAAISLPLVRLSSVRALAQMALPVDVTVGGDIVVQGRLPYPDVNARLQAKNFVAAGFSLGDATISASGTVGSDLKFESDSFFEGFELESAGLTFVNKAPKILSVAVKYDKFSLKRVLPSLPDIVETSATGTGSVIVDFTNNDEPFAIKLSIPQGGATACLRIPPQPLCFDNDNASAVHIGKSGIGIDPVKFTGGGHSLEASGSISFEEGFNLYLKPEIALSSFRELADAFASYGGTLMSLGSGIHLGGKFEDPVVRGFLSFKDLSLMPRNLGEEITIDPGSRISVSGQLMKGDLNILITPEKPISGKMDEGTFEVSGSLAIQGWQPETLLLSAMGQNLFFQVPGEMRIVFSPKLEAKFEDLHDFSATTGLVSGDVFIAEGEFSKDFDRLMGSFQSAGSREQVRYTRPITEVLPFLPRTQFHINVKGGNLAVSSKFPFGEAEMIVELDMRVRGTLDQLEIWDRVRVVPGGTITYKVVKRVFSVTAGSVDFYGDPAAPYMDVVARTEVIYTPPADYVSTWTQEERDWGRPVNIEIHITGIFPNITFELTSDSPEFDVADLQTLLLLGMTRRDLEGRGESGSSDVSINLLTEDVAGLVSKLILAPFVDAMSLGFTQEGGIRAEAATRIGRAMNLTTKVRQDSTRSEYSAGFQFRITDWLTLEGKLKMIQEQSESMRNYEGKFRYTIPLE